MKQCKQIIGLTGGIATGKSTASNIFKEKGFMVIDADEIAQNILSYLTPAYNEVVEYFGESILLEDGSIDRQALGDLIFSDEEKREKLNNITHRRILEEIIRQRDRALQEEKFIIIDIPLLIEERKLLEEFGIIFDEVVLIYTDRETQIKRLMNRDSIEKDSALEKINSQMNIEDKKDKVDVLINNNATKEDLELAINKYIDTLCD